MSFRVSQSRPRPRVHFEFTGLSGFLNFWDSECYRPRVPAGCKWALILCKGANSPSVNYRRQQWSARSDKFWSAPRCKLKIKMCQNIYRSFHISLKPICTPFLVSDHEGVETMNAYAPLDWPAGGWGRNLKSVPPPHRPPPPLSQRLPLFLTMNAERYVCWAVSNKHNFPSNLEK